MYVRAYDANILRGGRQGDFHQSFLVHVSPCDGLLRSKKLTFCGEGMFFTFHFFTQNSLFLVVFVVKMRI